MINFKENMDNFWFYLSLIRPSWLSSGVTYRFLVFLEDSNISAPVFTLRTLLEMISKPFARTEKKVLEEIHQSPRKPMTSLAVGRKNYFGKGPFSNAKFMKGIGRNFFQTCVLGETVLHSSCKSGNVQKLSEALLTPNVNINVRDNNGWTPLHEACLAGRIECVRKLLSFNPNTVTRHFSNPSNKDAKVKRGRFISVDLLAKAGEDDVTPLHEAAESGNAEIVREIMEALLVDQRKPEKGTLKHVRK